LSPAGASITSAGGSIYNAVRDLDDQIDRMPESEGWAGNAHKAATEMFRRATDRSSAFKDYAEAFGGALQSGSASIGRARNQLLSKADEIDAGELRVTDQWVVMIDPAEMSAEKAAELQKQAEAAQADVNELLHAVDKADESTMRQLLSARTGEGAKIQNLEVGSPGLPSLPPGDDVLDPSKDEGKQFQEIARAQDMATTIREVSETVDRDGNLITTYTMLDGSTQVTTEYTEDLPSQMDYPTGTIKVVHTDKNGNFVSETMTTPREDGGKLTEVWYANGTKIDISETADGTRTGSCTTPTSYSVLPDSFFNDPVQTLAGGALSGLEVKAGQGIPKLSTDVLEGLKGGAKFGGPAMGIATMAYNMVSADTLHEKCVAAWSGGVGLAGGALTTVAVAAIPGVGPFAAMGANTAGGFLFGYVGELVGNVLCPPP
jgi:hypothetical protein